MRKVILLLCCASLTFNVYAQTKSTSKKLPPKAQRYYEMSGDWYNKGLYKSAKDALLKVIELAPNHIEAQMRLGTICYLLNEFECSRDAYLKVLSLDSTKIHIAFFYAAEAEYKLMDYQKARSHFEKFLTYQNIYYNKKLQAQKYIKSCDFAIEAMKNPVPFDPVNLGSSVNSPNHEYLPALTADEQVLIFTRRLSSGRLINEDFYISKKLDSTWSEAIELGKPINTSLNEGAQAVSPDGKYLYFTGCNRKNGLGSCDIFVAKKAGDKWTKPVNIGTPVNSQTWESQPSISSDGKALYFSSNRKGGQGGRDIWVSYKNDNNEWDAPVNLGAAINTKGEEQSPFIHPDNKTLYYSTDGIIGMGAPDLYIVRKDKDSKWGKPKNLGYPINTAHNENGLVVSADGETAYFSSGRFDGEGKTDLYYFNLYNEARPGRVSYVKGTIFDKETNKKLESVITLIDLKTGKTVIEAESDSITGEYLVCLLSGKNYALNVDRAGYLFHSENFSLKDINTGEPFLIDVAMQRLSVGGSVVLRNIFYETDAYILKNESKAELNKLITFLQKNPSVKIQISGHTDNVGDKAYNKKLSENRAHSVYNYLVSNKIPAIKLSYVGYGEEQPIAANDTEAGRAQNRRTEFKVTGK